MEQIYLAKLQDKSPESGFEGGRGNICNAIEDFESSSIDKGIKIDSFVFDKTLKSSDILSLAKFFRRDMTKMYIMSCLMDGDRDSRFRDDDIIDLCYVVYQTWLKDESDLPICVISDTLIEAIYLEHLSVSQAIEMAGREMVRYLYEEMSGETHDED